MYEGLSWRVFVWEYRVWDKKVERSCLTLELENPALRWPCSSLPSIGQGPSLRMIKTNISG